MVLGTKRQVGNESIYYAAWNLPCTSTPLSLTDSLFVIDFRRQVLVQAVLRVNEEGKVAGRGALSLVRRAIDIWQSRSRWSACITFHVTYQDVAIHKRSS